MLIRKSDWETISDHFSEDEKEALNLAVTGEVLCPAGSIVDADALGKELVTKLTGLLPKQREAQG